MDGQLAASWDLPQLADQACRKRQAIGFRFSGHGLALLCSPLHPAAMALRYRSTNKKSPDQKRGFSLQLTPQAEIEPTIRRLGLDISNYSLAFRIRRSRDGNDEINDLFDLQASLIGLIVSSQTSLQQLLNQGVDQQLAITLMQ